MAGAGGAESSGNPAISLPFCRTRRGRCVRFCRRRFEGRPQSRPGGWRAADRRSAVHRAGFLRSPGGTL